MQGLVPQCVGSWEPVCSPGMGILRGVKLGGVVSSWGSPAGCLPSLFYHETNEE